MKENQVLLTNIIAINEQKNIYKWNNANASLPANGPTTAGMHPVMTISSVWESTTKKYWNPVLKLIITMYR